MFAFLIILIAFLAFFSVLWLWTQALKAKAERLVPRDGHMTTVNEGALHWREWGVAHKGVKRTIIFIHGVGAQKQHFGPKLVECLASRHHVVAVDRPGSGYSTRPRSQDASFETQAAQIAQLIKREKWDACIVVGHSLGGGIALRMAINHPDCLACLALLAPVTHLMETAPPAFQRAIIPNKWIRRFIANFGSSPLALAIGPRALKSTFYPEMVVSNYKDADMCGGWLTLRPRAIECFSEDLLAAPESLANLEQEYSTLAGHMPRGGILFGTKDAVLRFEEHGETLAKALPSLDLQPLTNAGHMFLITQPQTTADFILEQAKKA